MLGFVPRIETELLTLVPLTAACLRASARGDRAEVAKLLGVEVPEDWRLDSRLVEMRLKQIDEDPELADWLLHAIVDPNASSLVGHIGFHARPGHACLGAVCPGGVEVGYTVCGDHRRRGFASAALLALVGRARETGWVTRVVACIGLENEASLAMAAKLGCVRLGVHDDEDDGPEIIFEIP